MAELFANRRYDIDYYQREYRWERKQVAQLIDDLVDVFRESYRDTHTRDDVETYGQYFLGPVILTQRESVTDIVDGQQRLTTLTLMLIALRHRIEAEDDRGTIANLIVTARGGKRTFTLAVDDRAVCMDAIYTGDDLDLESEDPSVLNLIARFTDIEELLEDAVEPQTLLHFTDWLMFRVKMVTVVATTEEDAYTIFETMNDRGLRLTAPEMLRGYLLSQITHSTGERFAASESWKERIRELSEIGKEEDVDAIQAWLRGRYAMSASQYRAGVSPGDYERIGNEFHRWVRDVQVSLLSLQSSTDFVEFIRKHFAFYTRWYARLRQAAEGAAGDLKVVGYIASQGFTLQYMLILSALDDGDNEDIALRKIQAVAAYVDILIHRRLWNSMRIGQTSLRYPLFELAKRLRQTTTVEEVADLLTTEIESNSLDFQPGNRFQQNLRNSNIVRRILARLTVQVDHARVGATSYSDLLATGKSGYDIEHVLPSTLDWNTSGFGDARELEEERNWVGGLLLIPARVNRSYKDIAYQEKRVHYLKENRLAASLHELAYKRDPAFESFLKESGLQFKAHELFVKQDLQERQLLYEQIATQVWSPKRIRQEAGL